MRKRHRVLILAGLAAALIVPLGFALSIESSATSPSTQAGLSAGIKPVGPVGARAPIAANVPIVMATDIPRPPSSVPTVPDGVQLGVAGGLLLALATVVRRRG